jgi:hypothetical protein
MERYRNMDPDDDPVVCLECGLAVVDAEKHDEVHDDKKKDAGFLPVDNSNEPLKVTCGESLISRVHGGTTVTYTCVLDHSTPDDAEHIWHNSADGGVAWRTESPQRLPVTQQRKQELIDRFETLWGKALVSQDEVKDLLKPPGAWFVFGYDGGTVDPEYVFATKIEAQEKAAPHEYVGFWPFGVRWGDFLESEGL